MREVLVIVRRHARLDCTVATRDYGDPGVIGFLRSFIRHVANLSAPSGRWSFRRYIVRDLGRGAASDCQEKANAEHAMSPSSINERAHVKRYARAATEP